MNVQGGEITISIISLLSLLVAAGGGAVAIWIRVEGKIKLAETTCQVKVNEARTEIALVQKELTTHKLDSMREFASVGHLKEVEKRLITALDRLAEKIEERWPPRPGHRQGKRPPG